MSSAVPFTPQPATPPPRRNPWGGRVLILSVIALVVVPIAWNALPTEKARWIEAAANEAYLNGELDEALERIGDAIERDPDNFRLHLTRAQWRVEAREYEAALSDVDRALELQPRQPAALAVRSQAYQHLDLHEEAIGDWKQIKDMSVGNQAASYDLATILNGLAYARAVGNRELDEALEDADRAVELAGKHDAMLDCLIRCFIENNVSEKDSAFQYAQRELTDLNDAVKRGVYDIVGADFPPSPHNQIKLKRLASQQRRYTDRLELMHLIAADRDTGDDDRFVGLVSELPEIETAVGQCDSYAALTDTRGFIKLQQGNADGAIKDLDAAVYFGEAAYRYKAQLSGRARHFSPDIREYFQRLDMAEHGIAVMHYHRALTREALGDDSGAVADRDRVRSLGFQPTPMLF